jgi:hypothetical protein
LKTDNLLRRQIINDLMPEETENVADAAISLWKQLAAQVISIVGEGGFNALYARSVYVSQSTFPWLASDVVKPPLTDHRFAELKISLEENTPAQAREANSLLLITFTGILASLIGEQLTSRILRSAWGDDPSKRWHED